MLLVQGWEDCHSDTRANGLALLGDLARISNQVMITDTSCPKKDDDGDKTGACWLPKLQRDLLPFLPNYMSFHLSAMLTSLELIWDPSAGNASNVMLGT